MAVHDPVVPRGGEVHDATHHDVSVVNDRSVFGVVNAEDADFGFVDDGRCSQSTKSTEARDGEGGPGQVVHPCFSVSGGLRHAHHLGSRLPDVHGFHMLHDGNVEPTVGLRGDAEVDGFVSVTTPASSS